MPITKKDDENPQTQTQNKGSDVARENVAPEAPVKQDAPEQKETKEDKPQSYVWLADGSVVRCFDEDLPVGVGTGSPYGFWQRGNKVYVVVGIYPVEHTVEEN